LKLDIDNKSEKVKLMMFQDGTDKQYLKHPKNLKAWPKLTNYGNKTMELALYTEASINVLVVLQETCGIILILLMKKKKQGMNLHLKIICGNSPEKL
jgi:hypothetical protein